MVSYRVENGVYTDIWSFQEIILFVYLLFVNYDIFYAEDNFSLFKVTKIMFLVHSSQNVYKFGSKICYYITREKEKPVR